MPLSRALATVVFRHAFLASALTDLSWLSSWDILAVPNVSMRASNFLLTKGRKIRYVWINPLMYPVVQKKCVFGWSCFWDSRVYMKYVRFLPEVIVQRIIRLHRVSKPLLSPWRQRGPLWFLSGVQLEESDVFVLPTHEVLQEDDGFVEVFFDQHWKWSFRDSAWAMGNVVISL